MSLPPDLRVPRAPDDPGDAAGATVDEAMAGLDGLAERPPAEHVAVFERIHAALGEALAAAPTAGDAPGRA